MFAIVIVGFSLCWCKTTRTLKHSSARTHARPMFSLSSNGLELTYTFPHPQTHTALTQAHRGKRQRGHMHTRLDTQPHVRVCRTCISVHTHRLTHTNTHTLALPMQGNVKSLGILVGTHTHARTHHSCDALIVHTDTCHSQEAFCLRG